MIFNSHVSKFWHGSCCYRDSFRTAEFLKAILFPGGMSMGPELRTVFYIYKDFLKSFFYDSF